MLSGHEVGVRGQQKTISKLVPSITSMEGGEGAQRGRGRRKQIEDVSCSE